MTRATPLTDPLEGRIIYVLVMTILVQFTYPISAGGGWPQVAFQLFYMSLFVAGIYLVSSNRLLMSSLIVASVAWVIVGTIGALRPQLQWANVIGYLIIIYYDNVTLAK